MQEEDQHVKKELKQVMREDDGDGDDGDAGGDGGDVEMKGGECAPDNQKENAGSENEDTLPTKRRTRQLRISFHGRYELGCHDYCDRMDMFLTVDIERCEPSIHKCGTSS